MGYKHIEVKQVAGYIGAEIGGVDLSRSLSDEQVQEIRKALLKWKVLFFRNQNIDHAAQVEFTSRFGEVTFAHPLGEPEPVPGFPQLKPVDRKLYERQYGFRTGGPWHTDVTAAINPPAASVLRAVTVPSFGGDTQWSNLVAAYEGLSAPLRDLADTLKAEHRFNGRGYETRDNKFNERIAVNPLVSIHPVVRVHPETGERALFVNPGFVSRIVNVSPDESKYLLELFFKQVTKPAYTTRFRWNSGDIAFWDNRATVHLAPQDLDHLDVERLLYRTTITGDVPVGVDGSRSEVVHGEAFSAEVPSVFKQKAGSVAAQPALSSN
ncbi:taurine catabolism dioxygenase TauD/TfdA [Tolypothrix tenuis PCC 7101]|uniref:Taurine catabolism dioxygenase TauD/TfdA n=1 Tax=Tolypothrix tenuis PCC 7101 TaxID=231146 RepID=A0A1Z4N9Z9_9CYAN|nr:TauD/TfdA family dioxygenase [Aulosira sp. FACHB-113]BAZ02554.1 taurine catabolism dioxygenase TauD/TfdA [Tolypothrix tenuis PCC 7101]BAZ73525.1 taurine catabolism dioxygenase TauD/TfdA [Aulosira laxa NIES-50]